MTSSHFDALAACGVNAQLAIASSSSQHGSPAEHIVLCPGWEMSFQAQSKGGFFSI